MPAFQIGERVWALSGDQWWPAQVVLGSIHNIESAPTETVVKYYSADADANDFDVLVDDMLEAYEESSEKAASLDAALLGAMEACRNDADALPLRDAPAVGSKRSRNDEGAASSKHHRKEKHAAASSSYEDGAAAAGSSSKASSSTKAVTVMKTQTDLVRATAVNDIVTARRCLLKLSNERITYELLRETKVGVAVANLLGIDAMRALHPLAKAIVCDWAAKLPKETISAIKHELDVSTLH